MVYLILTPFLCMAGMFLIDAVKDKIKSALAKKSESRNTPFMFCRKTHIQRQ